VVLHDIANRRHAEKALEAGVDGVIAVAAGGPAAYRHDQSLRPDERGAPARRGLARSCWRAA